MAAKRGDDFKRNAVGIVLTSGLTRRRVGSDVGVGLSTLGKRSRAVSEEAGVPEQDAELLRENERLRHENRILREEREALKKQRWLQLVTATARLKVSAGAWNQVFSTALIEHSTQYFNDTDLQAIAVYMDSLPSTTPRPDLLPHPAEGQPVVAAEVPETL